MKRAVFILVAILFLLSVSSLTGLIRVVKADSGTIYIKADGSIDPPTAPVSTVDNATYVFNADINNQPIVVQRNNITIDGRGHVLQGSNVTFSYGMDLSSARYIRPLLRCYLMTFSLYDVLILMKQFTLYCLRTHQAIRQY